jgi:hypothetical protein
MRFKPNGAKRSLGFMGCGNDEYGNYGAPFSVGAWHHVVYTYDGSEKLQLYVDGKLSTSWNKDGLDTV